jgi:hypothetical protein
MSLRLSIKGCEDITRYYFGRTEGGLVGAFYCMARSVVRTEEDNCVAEPWAGYSWVGYPKELGRLYVFSKPWEVSEVFRLSRGFRPLCTPPVRWGGGVSRWWGFGYAILKGDFGDAYIDVYGVVTENLEFVKMDTPYLFDKVERCRGMFERGSGSLVGAELPVVRRQFGYLRVGGWLAWHRVLGLLDGGRWVLLGDDGLYEAVFTPTVKEPLEVFGEVGYVSVLRPYEGDVEDVASPCGAPRLVACGEEGVGVGRAVLRYVRGGLEEVGVRPEFFMGEFRCGESFIFPELVEVGIPARVIHDWPLADPCPHVLRAANCEPFGLFTSETRVPPYY